MSTEKYPALRAKTTTGWPPPNPAGWDRPLPRKTPNYRKANPQRARESRGPTSRHFFHREIAPDRAGTAQYQKPKRARQFSSPEQRPEFPAQLRAEIACDFQNFPRTSLPAYAPQEIHAPNIHDNVSHQQNQNQAPTQSAPRDETLR